MNSAIDLDADTPPSRLEAVFIEALALYESESFQAAYDLLKEITPEKFGKAAYEEALVELELHMGDCANELKQADLAFQHFRKANELNPTAGGVAQSYVPLLLNRGEFTRAESVCNTVLRNTNALRGLGDDGIEDLLTLRGIAYTYIGNSEQAIKDLANIKSDSPAGSYYLGLNYIVERRYDQALDSLAKVPKTYPCYEDARQLMGACANLMGRHNDAADYYKEVTTKIPRLYFSQAHYEILSDMFENKEYQEALDHTQSILKILATNDRDYVHRLRDAAICHRELGDLNQAEHIMTRILPRAFKNPMRYYTTFGTAAKCLLEQGQFENAIAIEQLALDVCAQRKSVFACQFALSGMKSMAEIATKGGYPVLAQICNDNAELLETTLTEKLPFPELRALTLE